MGVHRGRMYRGPNRRIHRYNTNLDVSPGTPVLEVLRRTVDGRSVTPTHSLEPSSKRSESVQRSPTSGPVVELTYT